MTNQDLTENGPASRTSAALSAILALALVCRAVFAFFRDAWPVSTDESQWEVLGILYKTMGMVSPSTGTYRPPLYPLTVAGIYGLLGDDTLYVRLFQAVLGTATCGLVFLVGTRYGGKRVGLTAAAGAAVYPLFVFFTGVLMVETELVFLTTAALLLAGRLMDRPDYGRALALGGALGAAALCKSVVLAWLPLLAPALWPAFRPLGLDGLSRLAAMACGVLLVLLPWTIRNKVVTGQTVFVSSNVGMNLLVGHEPGANGEYQYGKDYLRLFDRLSPGVEDAVEKDQIAARRAVSWMVEDPARTLRLSVQKTLALWSPLASGESRGLNAVSLFSVGPLLCLGLWGLAAGAGDRGVSALILSMAAAFTLAHVVFFAHTRFRLPVDAALMAPAAERAIVVGQAAWVRVRRRWAEL